MRLQTAFAAVSAVMLGACAVGPNYRVPQIALPGRFAAAPVSPTSDGVELASWWQALKDPELDSLIGRAITEETEAHLVGAAHLDT